jgi:hypothetical protein
MGIQSAHFSTVKMLDDFDFKFSAERRPDVGAHQEPRNSGRLADGMRIGRKLAGVAVHG